MRSIAGPSRTRRPRKANGSIRKGWIRSSGAVWLGLFKLAGSEISGRALKRELTETPGEDTLLGMQPVLCLVPDDRLRAINDPGSDFFAALCRQAMHEDGVRLGMRHQLLVDAVPGQHVVAVDARFNAHRDPGIGDDAVRPRDSLHRVGGQFDATTLAARPIEEPLRRAEVLRTGEPKREAEANRRVNPAGRDVVAVAAPGHDLACDRTLLLLQRHHIGHDLAWV